MPSYRLDSPCPETYWLPGRNFAAGPYPGFDFDMIRALLDAGVRGFIDLTEEHELESYEAFVAEEAERRGIDVTYARFSIRDGCAPDPGVMEQILDSLSEAHASQRVTYFHCWGGIGRTGTVAACWLMEQGHSSDEALEIVQSLNVKYRRPSLRFPRSPETDAQHDFVRSWALRGG